MWFSPFVEYKGSVPQEEFQVKQKELEAEANELISKGGKVSPHSLFTIVGFLRFFVILLNSDSYTLYKVYAAILPYEEASVLCGGSLPDYISKVFANRNSFLDF